MSAEATGQVWKSSPYSGAPLLVHLAIADVVNDIHDNEFWMSTGKLARKARVSRSTVTATLSDMVQRGHLVVLQAGGLSREPTRYRWAGLGITHATSAISASTSAIQGQSLARSPVTNPIEPKNTKADSACAVSGLVPRADCVQCRGTGIVFSGAGFDRPCLCVDPVDMSLVALGASVDSESAVNQ